MSEDLMNQFKEIEKTVEENKVEKVRLEERFKTLTEEKEKLLAELSKLGIKEEELVGKIESLDKEIREEITKCKDQLK